MVRPALPCMVELDNASMSTPPRLAAALSKIVANLTPSLPARQLTAMDGRPGSAAASANNEVGAAMYNAPVQRARERHLWNDKNCASRAPLQRVVRRRWDETDSLIYPLLTQPS